MPREGRSPAIDVVTARNHTHRFNPTRAQITPAARQITPTTAQAITTRDHLTPSLEHREIVAGDRETIPQDLHVLRGRFPTPGDRRAPA
jgi:hypothetical protein